MWDMVLNVLKDERAIAFSIVLLAAFGCTPASMTESPRDIQLSQKWELQPGDVVAGRQVLGGLGDISLALNGDAIYAPFDGRVQPHKPNCVIFSSEEMPVYLFRLCGLNQQNFGFRRAGQPLGTGDELRLALLTKQPDGRWAIVEPSKKIIEKMLQPS